MLRVLVATALAFGLVLPSVHAAGANVGDAGGFVGYGVLEYRYNGALYGECAAAFAIASEPDGGWRITGVKTYVPVVQYCNSWCCGSIAWYPGAVDAQGAPETGFAGETELLGVKNVVEVGPLGSATSFVLRQTSTGNSGTWSLEGTLDFGPIVSA